MPPSSLQAALEKAPSRPVPRKEAPEREVFVFLAGAMHFGVASGAVREVTRIEPMTPLPRAPAFMLGAFGHRGEVLPVIDLLRFLALGELKVSSRTRLFVGMNEQHVVAFATEGIVGLRRVKMADIMPAPVGGGSTEYLSGVAALKDLGTLHLLELPRVINSSRQKVLTR